MKRKIFVFVSAGLILIGGALIAFFNSDYYYSKRLVSAIREENIASVQGIIEKRPDCINKYPSITSKKWHSAMNQRVCYPLNEACSTGNKKLITLLLENGANPNCNDGLTPLSIVYSSKPKNWYAISLILIKNGASLDYTTEYSGGKSSILRDVVQVCPGSSLSEYKSENDDEVIKSFNYALENSNHKNVDWIQVLQQSALNNRIEIVKLLLGQGYCDVNDTSDGMTAIMFAARDSAPETVKLLLDYGANKDLKSDDGKTALDYAVESDNKGVITVLETDSNCKGNG